MYISVQFVGLFRRKKTKLTHILFVIAGYEGRNVCCYFVFANIDLCYILFKHQDNVLHSNGK